LVRGLYERGFSILDVQELFRLIDWMMELPLTLDRIFWQEVDKIQEEKRMPFISTPERVGHCKGLRKGIEFALEMRFGDAGLKLMPEVDEIYESEKLEAILNALKTATNPEEVRRLWSPGTP